MIETQPKQVPTARQDVDGWLAPGRFAVLLGGLMVACFPKVIFGFATFFYRDFSAFGYPMAFYHRESFWHAEMPLWNPYSLCGVPFLAQWNTLTLYPPSLFYLIFPLSWSLGVFNLAHMFLAGMGMYFLAHRWTGNRLAASVAGLAYAFNGLTWYALMWPNNIAALGWMPWVVLCVERAWREGSGRNVMVAGVVGAMQMLAGAPEVIILTWFALSTLWLSEWVQGEIPRGRMLGRLLGVGMLVAGLAAAQLLPFADLLLHSQRSTDFGTSDWSMPLGGWANYLVPFFHCSRGAQNIYTQDAQYWTGSYYLGIGTVALALLAIWRARDRRVWVLAGLALFGLTMALGDRGLLYAAVRRILPVMGFMRFPIKFVVLVTFAMPLLAAQAVSWWEALPESQRRTERERLWQLGGLLLAVTAFIIWWEWQTRRSAEDDPTVITINALVRVAFLIATLGIFGLLHKLKQPRLQQVACAGLLLLFWFDVFTHNHDLSPPVDRTVYEPDLMRQYHIKHGNSRWDEQLKLGAGRAMLTVGALSQMTFHATDSPTSDILGRRLALWSNCNLLDHAPKFDGFFSLTTPQTSKLITQVYMAKNNGVNDMPRLKDFLNISEINTPPDPTEWISRNTFLPVITAGQAPHFLDDTAALQNMMGAEFDPSQSVFLPPEARAFVTVTNQSKVNILSRQITAQQVAAELDAPAPALVVVAQSYYHLWHAYVDGQPARLLRANYAFQAVQVPAGRHVVRLVYEDGPFHLGIVISLGSAAVCLIILFMRRRNVLYR